MKRCSICKIVLNPQTIYPCGIAPKIIIDEDGRIWGRFKGCPAEQGQPAQYVALTDIGRLAKDEEKLAKRDSATRPEDYKSLWSARNGKDYHLTFDAKARYRRWHSVRADRVYFSYKSGK
jgi:hypothetical protein